jgi:hypothetical protein
MVVFFFAYLMTEYKSNFSLRWDELALLLSIVGIQVGLLRVLRPPAGHAAAAVPTAAAAVGALFSLGAIFYVSTVLNATVPILFEIPFLRADSVMMTSIPRVQACAVTYAKRTGQVPRTLGVMGPPPTGSGCLDEQYASGKIGRVSLEYRAQDSTRYSVVARVEREDRERSRMATGDQSGILRGGSAHDTLGFHVLSGSMNLVRGTRACAEYLRARAGGNSYPENPNEAYTGRSESDTQDDLLRLGCGWIPGKWGMQVWETWKYTPVRDSGRIVDYMVEVRPAVYGVRA